MKIAIEVTYSLSSSAQFELPDGKTWDDVSDYYVKWGTLHVLFEGNSSYHEIGEVDVDIADLDTKRPSSTRVLRVNAHGDTEYGWVLDET